LAVCGNMEHDPGQGNYEEGSYIRSEKLHEPVSHCIRPFRLMTCLGPISLHETGMRDSLTVHLEIR